MGRRFFWLCALVTIGSAFTSASFSVARYEHEPWFALGTGDRIRLLEVDVEQGIGRVEVLSGFCAGETCWLSLDCMRHD